MDIDLSGTSSYYQSVLRAWRSIFKVERDSSELGSWIRHEPLFNNPLIEVKELSLRSLRSAMAKIGCTKVSDLRNGNKWKSPEEMCCLTGIRSVRFMKIILNRIFSSLPSTLRQLQEENEPTLQDNDENYNFPELKMSAAIEEEPEKDSILNFF